MLSLCKSAPSKIASTRDTGGLKKIPFMIGGEEHQVGSKNFGKSQSGRAGTKRKIFIRRTSPKSPSIAEIFLATLGYARRVSSALLGGKIFSPLVRVVY
jgi:hypothetical protein